MAVNFFLISFLIILFILVIYYPLTGNAVVKKIKQDIADNNHDLSKYFKSHILWSWLPLLIIFVTLYVCDIHVSEIGLKSLDGQHVFQWHWVSYLLIGFSIIYIVFYLFLTIHFKNNPEATEKFNVEEFEWVLPVTKNEKKWWVLVSINAGIGEEIVYRGYLFYALGVFFPSWHIAVILLVSTAIFGIGHIYLGKDAIKSTLLGLLYGAFYIFFDSLIPVMIMHLAQDLVVTYLRNPDHNALQGPSIE